MDHPCNYKLTFYNLDHINNEFKRHFFKDDKTVYIYSYKKIIDKIQVVIKDINGVTGKEVLKTFEAPYADVKAIDSIDYNRGAVLIKSGEI